jgi:hypothetical protein
MRREKVMTTTTDNDTPFKRFELLTLTKEARPAIHALRKQILDVCEPLGRGGWASPGWSDAGNVFVFDPRREQQ